MEITHIKMEDLKAYLKTELSDFTEELDHDFDRLKWAFDLLRDKGCLSYFLSPELGGQGMQRDEFIAFYKTIAAYSGVLSFLMSQHQVSMIYMQKLAEHESIREILNAVVKEKKALAYCSVVQKTSVELELDNGEYYISGFLPWVTGYGIYDEIMLLFMYKGYIRSCIIPFKDLQSEDGEIKCGNIHDLVVFSSSNTVSIELKRLRIPCDNLYTIPMENGAKSLLKEHPTIYSFAAVSEVLLDLVKENSVFEREGVQKVYHKLRQELNDYSDELSSLPEHPRQFRARGYRIASDCSQFARLSLGGRTLKMNHPVQRISREIWSFSLAGLYEEQQSAYFQYLYGI